MLLLFVSRNLYVAGSLQLPADRRAADLVAPLVGSLSRRANGKKGQNAWELSVRQRGKDSAGRPGFYRLPEFSVRR